MAAPRRAAAAAAVPAPALAREDTRWLEALSEPELGFLIGLKELAVTRASNAGHPELAYRVFHLRALRALAFVLVQEFKERLRQASVNTNMLERLALLKDPEEESQHVMPMPMPMPNEVGGHKKRKQMQDGCDGEGAQCPKRRRESSREDYSCQSNH